MRDVYLAALNPSRGSPASLHIQPVIVVLRDNMRYSGSRPSEVQSDPSPSPSPTRRGEQRSGSPFPPREGG